MIILIGFILIGAYGLTSSDQLFQLKPSNWESPLNIVSGGMVIFVAYEGFELIANTIPNLKDYKKNTGKAFYISTGLVVILYVCIAIITVGSVSFDAIGKAQEYVLAVAAEPVLGKIGFVIISITALISTFSAINATLYGGSRVNYELAEEDELPHEFTKICWNQPIGLLLTSLLTLALANTLNLESISTAGSAGFLWIFALVNLANYRLASKTQSKKIVSGLGFSLCLVALAALFWQQFNSNRIGVYTVLCIFLIAYFVEWGYKTIERKKQSK